MPLCEHFETGVAVDDPETVCLACVAIGSTWHHLRQCLNCGQTLCCDNSPNRHATGHYLSDGHPMIRSAQPGEDWRWCYRDDLLFIPGAEGYEVAEE
ncbi:MAG: UBP-type zinc finger domain-containing protein [Chloroflexi bacterium]|nr:UBP-type zinc finger domain-containing protein [Chloroflexota bacterium]